MAVYRLYCMSGLGKIGHVESIDACDDSEAIRLAYAMKLDVVCELWDHDRLVAHIEPYEDEESRFSHQPDVA